MPQMGLWVPGYGFGAWVGVERISPDGQKYLHFELRDPMETYPGDWGVDQQPEDVAFLRHIPLKNLIRLYPQYTRDLMRQANADSAAREARIPVGFMPCITAGMRGEHLTEMAELRDLGALGFTDDGKPVHRAGLLRKALQYQKLVGAIIALHEEDPTLSGKGVVHEGEVSARLGLEGIPSISESTLIARDASLAGYEGGRIHIQHLSARESVEAVAAAKARGVQITAEESPHHLTLTDAALLDDLEAWRDRLA